MLPVIMSQCVHFVLSNWINYGVSLPFTLTHMSCVVTVRFLVSQHGFTFVLFALEFQQRGGLKLKSILVVNTTNSLICLKSGQIQLLCSSVIIKRIVPGKTWIWGKTNCFKKIYLLQRKKITENVLRNPMKCSKKHI